MSLQGSQEFLGSLKRQRAPEWWEALSGRFQQEILVQLSGLGIPRALFDRQRTPEGGAFREVPGGWAYPSEITWWFPAIC